MIADRDEIRTTLRRLLPQVRRHLVRLLGNTPDLDDATQDVLTEIARFLPRFEGRSKLETAVHRITVRVAYRYYGRRTNDVPLDDIDTDIAAEDSIPEDRLQAREALARLQRCLARLPAKRRIAFVLCAIDGLTPTEAAAVANTTAIAMRCRLLWARRELARMLANDPYLGVWLRDAAEEAA